MTTPVRRCPDSPDSGEGIMMNRMQDNDYQAMKQRLVTICEVQAGTISATEAAERLGVSRKTFYEYMDAFVKAAAEALTPGDPGRPKLSEETRKIRQLEAEKKRLENELYEAKAISELQSRIIAIRDSQLAEREKKKKRMSCLSFRRSALKKEEIDPFL